jgi:hypothetical protein
MASSSVSYHSSISCVIFNVLGCTYRKSGDDAAAQAQEMEETSPPFTNLVMARAYNGHSLEDRHATIFMEMALYTHPGPFTPKQFIKMMQFPITEPTSKWVEFMKNFKPISLSSCEQYDESNLKCDIVTQVFKKQEGIRFSLSTMSITFPSSMSLVKYDVLGDTHMGECTSAASLARPMVVPYHLRPLNLFTNVVIARAVNVPSLQGEQMNLSIVMAMWNHSGPFTPAQFIKMMQFPTERTSSEWLEFISSFTLTNISFNEKEREHKRLSTT